MADDFPSDVRQFIERNIDSLAQLELLLLLRNEKTRWWNVTEISKCMSFSPEMTAALLLDLKQRDFAAKVDDKYRYSVVDSATDEVVGLLGETYRARRVSVTTEIYSKPNKQLKSFADAFRVRKEQ